MRPYWLITKRSDHAQYFRGLYGRGTYSSPAVAEWTPYRRGGVQYLTKRRAFEDAWDIWGPTWRGAVRVVRVTGGKR